MQCIIPHPELRPSFQISPKISSNCLHPWFLVINKLFFFFAESTTPTNECIWRFFFKGNAKKKKLNHFAMWTDSEAEWPAFSIILLWLHRTNKHVQSPSKAKRPAIRTGHQKNSSKAGRFRRLNDFYPLQGLQLQLEPSSSHGQSCRNWWPPQTVVPSSPAPSRGR